MILAVVSLVIALAQFRVARSKATPTIALVIDASNSMDATDVQPNRLSAAESAAQAFLQQLPPEFAVSLVSFADEPKVLVAPTTDHTQVANALGDLPRGQGTVIGDGLASAMDTIEKYQEGSQAGPAAIVLLSDGNDTGSKTPPLDAAADAADRDVPVYTVILGAPKQGGGGANADLLNQIATSTGAVIGDRADLERAVERLRTARLAAVVPAEDQQLGAAVRVHRDRAGGRRRGDPPAHDAAAVLGGRAPARAP